MGETKQKHTAITKYEAGRMVWSLRQAWEGAQLCRQRILEALDGSFNENGWIWLVGLTSLGHDTSYYAWEATRIDLIAERIAAWSIATDSRRSSGSSTCVSAFRKSRNFGATPCRAARA